MPIFTTTGVGRFLRSCLTIPKVILGPIHVQSGSKPPKMAKNSEIIFLMPIVTTRGGAHPKVMGTIESSLLICFFGTLQSLIRHTVMEILCAGNIPEEVEEEQELEEVEEYHMILWL